MCSIFIPLREQPYVFPLRAHINWLTLIFFVSFYLLKYYTLVFSSTLISKTDCVTNKLTVFFLSRSRVLVMQRTLGRLHASYNLSNPNAQKC